MTPTRRHVPILIIGSGVAGCTAALTLADAGCDVLLLNVGDNLADGNSELAQGGIIYRAAPAPGDPESERDAAALEKDILVAGIAIIIARRCAGSAARARPAWMKC